MQEVVSQTAADRAPDFPKRATLILLPFVPWVLLVLAAWFLMYKLDTAALIMPATLGLPAGIAVIGAFCCMAVGLVGIPLVIVCALLAGASYSLTVTSLIKIPSSRSSMKAKVIWLIIFTILLALNTAGWYELFAGMEGKC